MTLVRKLKFVQVREMIETIIVTVKVLESYYLLYTMNKVVGRLSATVNRRRIPRPKESSNCSKTLEMIVSILHWCTGRRLDLNTIKRVLLRCQKTVPVVEFGHNFLPFCLFLLFFI